MTLRKVNKKLETYNFRLKPEGDCPAYDNIILIQHINHQKSSVEYWGQLNIYTIGDAHNPISFEIDTVLPNEVLMIINNYARNYSKKILGTKKYNSLSKSLA